LLLALGDRQLAAATASRALAAGMSEAARMHHPERAAVWLRRRVIRELPAAKRFRPRRTPPDAAALAELGAAPAVLEALAQLPFEQRAIFIAGEVERLDERDVAWMLGQPLSATRRALRDARARYLAATISALRASPSPAPRPGPIARRVEEATARTIGIAPAMRPR
jgi:DNA-directed RNA polymerase specialized sigma24 family protein